MAAHPTASPRRDFLEPVMKVSRQGPALTIQGDTYSLRFDPSNPLYVDLTFANGLGAELFVASGCDRDELIDQIETLQLPELKEAADSVTLAFTGQSTLWEKVVYTFTCTPQRVFYSYTVHGQGSLDNARYFEGFLKDNPKLADRYYPYFAGWGRHVAHHRPWKWFAHSSKPKFDLVHCFSINSSDTRQVMYYENIEVRVCGNRVNLGGDWLVTPPPFLYQLGRKPGLTSAYPAEIQAQKDGAWVNVGLLCPADKNEFEQFEYLGGEGVGFNLTFDGYTQVVGSWESPKLMFEAAPGVYQGLDSYCRYLRDQKLVRPNAHRAAAPRWWFEPIFGGWGEQVFRSDHWSHYFGAKSTGWSGGSDMECSQPRYEWMLRTLEEKKVFPTLLIVDNRWFRVGNQLEVDNKLWPDMKQFIADQHKAGRKVILWVSPWEYCQARRGDDVRWEEHLFSPRDGRYTLEIDTDVFYPSCKRDPKKVRKEYPWGSRDYYWTCYPNPFHKGYQKRVFEKVQYLLSPEGLNADGFEFDYTHYWGGHRGITVGDPQGCEDGGKPHCGVELLHKLLGLFYHAAKAAKKDALVITHTFNPYFDDIVDMLRLQDIYTDRADIVPQMHHRAIVGNAVCPGAPIHTDQHPMPSLAAWRKFAEFQPSIGNPCLYYVSGIETTHEEFVESDFELLRRTWGEYHKQLDARFPRPRK
ncbi:MAG: hypothetical protein IT443_04120 [Phycisphaeraceae bacterium]|nr:hypothetical protein [Phycisphaeraceae bacterium]